MTTATISGDSLFKGVNIASGNAVHTVPSFKTGVITLPATTTATGTATNIDIYDKWGMQKVLGIIKNDQTTADSVFVENTTGTSAVDRGLLTITIGGTAVAAKRTVIVYGV